MLAGTLCGILQKLDNLKAMKYLIICIFLVLTFSIKSLAQKPENFNSFFVSYATDEKFQLDRTKFPLEFITWENPTEIGGEIVTKHITKEDWEHNYFYMNEYVRPQIYDNHESELRDTDERLFEWIGIETGANEKYFFKRIDGLWYLIKKENLGD
jgi:hypothetical protein